MSGNSINRWRHRNRRFILIACCTSVPLFAVSATAAQVVVGPREESLARVVSPIIPASIQIPRISVQVDQVPLKVALEHIARQAKLSVVYGDMVSGSKVRVSLNVRNMSVTEAFDHALHGTGIIATIQPGGEVLFTRGGLVTSTPNRVIVTTGVLTGKVIDSLTGKGIAGVTVTVASVKRSAVTSENGAFRFSEIPVGSHTVSARLLGYVSKNVTVSVDSGKMAVATILFAQTSATLSEVVTTASGRQRRVEISNDIAKINVDSLLQMAPARNVSELLGAARIPGVEVTPSSAMPGSPTRIRMRGVGSITQDNDPIVIVDGIRRNAPMTSAALRNIPKNIDGLSPSPLNDIDPASIETIEIVRGPSAATLYGTDAANGVIIITTKRGQAGPARWDIKASHDWNDVRGAVPASYSGFGTGNASDAPIACMISTILAGSCRQDSISVIRANDPFANTEARGAMSVYNASVRGGISQLRYTMSVGHRNEVGPTKLDGYSEIRFRKLGAPIPGWLKRPATLQYTNFGAGIDAEPSRALKMFLTLDAVQSSGVNSVSSFADKTPTDTVLDRYLQLPLRTTQGRSDNDTKRAALAFRAIWALTDKLSPELVAGIDETSRSVQVNQWNTSCVRSDLGCGIFTANRALSREDVSVYTLKVRSALPSLFRRWERWVSLRPSLGADLVRQLRGGTTATGDSLGPGSLSISTAVQRSVSDVSTGVATAGWYVSMSIGVLQKMYTEIGLRQDGGSAIGIDAGLPRFPKLGTSWLVSEEKFFPKTDLLSTLRLRISYGQSAKQPAVGSVYGDYFQTEAFVNGQLVKAFTVNYLGNSRLRPERSSEFEYGADLDMFGARTNVGVTLSHKTNRDVLINRTLAPSVFATLNRMENVSRIINQTVEITSDTRVIDNPNMQWSVQLGFSHLANRVASLGRGVSPFGENSARIVEGYPVSGLWQRPVIAYNDLDLDGIINPGEVVIGDSLAYIGWPHPRYALSYASSLALLHGRVNIAVGLSQDVGLTQYQTRYTGRGLADPSAPVSEQAYAYLTTMFGDRQTISVLRFNNASINLNLPARFATQLRARSGRLSMQGSNLAHWTRYRGRDPGVNSRPLGELLRDDGTTLPPARKFALTVTLNY